MTVQLVLALRDASLDTPLRIFQKEGWRSRGKASDSARLCLPYVGALKLLGEGLPPSRPFIPTKVSDPQDVYSPQDQLLLLRTDDLQYGHFEVLTWAYNDEDSPTARFLKDLLHHCELQEADDHTLVHANIKGKTYQSSHKVALALPTKEGKRLLEEWWKRDFLPAWNKKVEAREKQQLATIAATAPKVRPRGTDERKQGRRKAKQKKRFLKKVVYQGESYFPSFKVSYSNFSPQAARLWYKLRWLPPLLFLLLSGFSLWALTKVWPAFLVLMVGFSLFMVFMTIVGTALEGGWMNSELLHTQEVPTYLSPHEKTPEDFVRGRLCALAFHAKWTAKENFPEPFTAPRRWEVELSPEEQAEVLALLFPSEATSSFEEEQEAAVRELEWRRKFS